MTASFLAVTTRTLGVIGNQIEKVNRLRFKETEEGEILIEGNILHCKHKFNIYNFKVNIDNLEYVYALVNRNNQAFLFCFDSHQNKIPVEFKGFKNAYKYLSERLGFNDDQFLKTINQTEISKSRIWKRSYDKNYKTIDNSIELSKGFMILNPSHEFIDWDRTVNSIHETDSIKFVTNEYNQKCIQFKGKVKIGNLEVNEFYGHLGKRNDAPILYYSAKLRNEKGNDESYFDAKKSLSNFKKSEDFYSFYEREDQNSITWERDGISKSITYWYDTQYGYESCYTSIVVRNKREYPHLYKNNDIIKKESIKRLYVFRTVLWSRDNYKEDPTIKEKPQLITDLSNGFPCIWINESEKTIGFGGQKFCQEFNNDDVESLHLQNVHPAKGSGASYFEIKLKGTDRKQHVLSGKYQDFDSYISEIEKSIGRKIVIEKEHADV